MYQIDLGRKQQVKNLVVVPVSFVSEHIETLEEIDMEYKELAIENGTTQLQNVFSLVIFNEMILTGFRN